MHNDGPLIMNFTRSNEKITFVARTRQTKNNKKTKQITEIGFNFSFHRQSPHGIPSRYLLSSRGSIINRTVSRDSITLFVFSLMRHFSSLIY